MLPPFPRSNGSRYRTLDAPAVLRVRREVKVRGRYESARRLGSTIGSVFRYAVGTAQAQNDLTFALQGALTKPTVTRCKPGS